MKFYEAIKMLDDNEADSMKLPHWHYKNAIQVQRPDEHSKMTAPYFYAESIYGKVPWIPTQIEMFSDEWIVY